MRWGLAENPLHTGVHVPLLHLSPHHGHAHHVDVHVTIEQVTLKSPSQNVPSSFPLILEESAVSIWQSLQCEMFLLSLLLKFWLLLFWLSVRVRGKSFWILQCHLNQSLRRGREWNTYLDCCCCCCWDCCCWHCWWCSRPAWRPPPHWSWRSRGWILSQRSYIILPAVAQYLLLERTRMELGRPWQSSSPSCSQPACTWRVCWRAAGSLSVWRLGWHSPAEKLKGAVSSFSCHKCTMLYFCL